MLKSCFRAAKKKEEEAASVSEEEQAQKDQIAQMQQLLQLQIQIKQQNLVKQFEKEEAEFIERAKNSGMSQSEIGELVKKQREKQEITKQQTLQNDQALMQQQLQGMAYSFAMQNQQIQLENDRYAQLGAGNVVAQDQMMQSQQFLQMQQQQQYQQLQQAQQQQQMNMANGGGQRDYRYREYL